MTTDTSHDRQATVDVHQGLAAFHLYEIVKPEGGLEWAALTMAQRAKYRGLIKLAERMTDVTAIRAAHERAASGLAAHHGMSLRDCAPAGRRSLRFEALAAVRAFEYQLMEGDAALDALTLSLVAEEQQAYLTKLHTLALAEDADEMVKRQARRDLDQDATGAGAVLT